LINQQIKHYRALNKWFGSPLGIAVADDFTGQLTPLNDYLRGETLIQLCHCGGNPWLDFLNFKHKWLVSPYFTDQPVDLVCSLNQIPINRNSVDCVIAPLTIEPFGSSHSLIDEIDRILKPMGFIILLSINPWSLWGGAMKSGLLHCFENNKIKMRTPFNMNRIFMQRGYRQCLLTNFCYIPPFNNQAIIKKLTIFNEIGKILWPFPSGFYCYIAQKYEPVSPSLLPEAIIQPVYKYKPSMQPVIN